MLHLNFCEIILKILIQSRAWCRDPFFPGSFILAEVEYQRDLVGALGKTCQMGYSHIIAVTDCKLVDLVACQHSNGVIAGNILHQGDASVPHPDHKGVIVPVQAKVQLGVAALFHKMKGRKKIFP